MMIKNKPLYIHIPFCQHLCAYCDFAKIYYDEKQADDYLDALISEIQAYHISDCPTIYIGGGHTKCFIYRATRYASLLCCSFIREKRGVYYRMQCRKCG